jgi:D-alanine-D-alanine ligase
VLLERHVHGRELAVSVIDDSDGARALPVVEAVLGDTEIYDFAARYSIGETRFVCPAEIPRAAAEGAAEVAVAAYRLLGCRGFARVDFMFDEAGLGLQLLEVNAVPGLTETSLLPIAADAAGIDFDDLVERMVRGALAVSRVSAR